MLKRSTFKSNTKEWIYMTMYLTLKVNAKENVPRWSANKAEAVLKPINGCYISLMFVLTQPVGRHSRRWWNWGGLLAFLLAATVCCSLDTLEQRLRFFVLALTFLWLLSEAKVPACVITIETPPSGWIWYCSFLPLSSACIVKINDQNHCLQFQICLLTDKLCKLADMLSKCCKQINDLKVSSNPNMDTEK